MDGYNHIKKTYKPTLLELGYRSFVYTTEPAARACSSNFWAFKAI